MSNVFKSKIIGNRFGFTLIELMIVIGIIGILAVVVVPKAMSSKDDAKAVGIDTNMRTIEGIITSVIDTNATAAELSKTLFVKFNAAGLKNPFSNSTNIIPWITHALWTGSSIIGLSTNPAVPPAVCIHDSAATSAKTVFDNSFAKDGTTPTFLNAYNAGGTVIVSITRPTNEPLQAIIYGVRPFISGSIKGTPITTIAKAIIVSQ